MHIATKVWKWTGARLSLRLAPKPTAARALPLAPADSLPLSSGLREAPLLPFRCSRFVRLPAGAAAASRLATSRPAHRYCSSDHSRFRLSETTTAPSPVLVGRKRRRAMPRGAPPQTWRALSLAEERTRLPRPSTPSTVGATHTPPCLQHNHALISRRHALLVTARSPLPVSADHHAAASSACTLLPQGCARTAAASGARGARRRDCATLLPLPGPAGLARPFRRRRPRGWCRSPLSTHSSFGCRSPTRLATR